MISACLSAEVNSRKRLLTYAASHPLPRNGVHQRQRLKISVKWLQYLDALYWFAMTLTRDQKEAWDKVMNLDRFDLM